MNAQQGQSHVRESYQRVFDGRKQPIRGLWVREGRYYARMLVQDPSSGRSEDRRVRLTDPKTKLPATTVAAAVAAMQDLKSARRTSSLPVLRQTPIFRDYAAEYLERIQAFKRAATTSKERTCLNRWSKEIGGVRLNKITKAMLNRFRDLRLSVDKVSPRTANLDMIALRNVLKRAQDDGHIREMPTAGMRAFKVSTIKRDLVPWQTIELLCRKAMEVSKNGRQFSDYLRLLCFSGARRDEALRLRWKDVDFSNGSLTIGSDSLAKNHQWRTVDFNAKLEAILLDMNKRKVPDSDWLFPSPQRGERDISSKTFKETLWKAKAAASIEGFGFHDCRHFFISHAVMAGVDFMTIARWAGHQDGGVLIGKTYGHLAEGHTKAAAKRVTFGALGVEGA